MPPKVSVPPNYEMLDRQDHGHNLIRCTLMLQNEKNEPIQCGHIIRNTIHPKPHICFPGESNTEEEKCFIMRQIACLIGKADLPLQIVEKPYFIEFINALVKIGKDHSTSSLQSLVPKLTRQKIREVLVQEAQNRTETELSLKRCEEGCTLSIDAGSLNARHFIDYVVSSKITPPFLFKATEKNFVTIEDYKNITEAILTELLEKKLKIVAIVTDNLYVQVAAMAHWYPDSLLNTSENFKIRQIFFFSCLCHTTDLIVSRAEKKCSILANLTNILQEMVTICRIQKVRAAIGARCPEMVITRWLSRIDSIDFILSNKQKLLEIKTQNDSLGLQAGQIAKYMTYITDENFDKITDLAFLIFPFHSLIKEFEHEKCRQYKAVPYFENLEKYLDILSTQPRFKNYAEIFVEFKQQIHYRKSKTLHWELLCAAYSLTGEGRIWLRRKIHETNPTSIGLSDKERNFVEKIPDFVYKPPMQSKQIEHESDLFTETLISNLDDSLHSQEITDLIRLGKSQARIAPPTHDLGLYSNIIETLKEAAIRIGESPDDIASVFDDYIFKRILEKEGEIGSIYPELFWNSFVLIPKMKSIVNVATRLLLAKASEACVERYFSKQKLVLNYLRLKSKEDLLNARFQLRE